MMRVEVCLKCLKRGWNRKDGMGNKDLKMGELGQGVGILKGGLENPLQTIVPSVFTLYSKLFKNLLATATFSPQILMYSLKPPPPHPLNDQNPLSMTKIFGCCTLLIDATKL